MMMLAFQIVAILLVAYGLGCIVGCWMRGVVYGADRELAADSRRAQERHAAVMGEEDPGAGERREKARQQ